MCMCCTSHYNYCLQLMHTTLQYIPIEWYIKIKKCTQTRRWLVGPVVEIGVCASSSDHLQQDFLCTWLRPSLSAPKFLCTPPTWSRGMELAVWEEGELSMECCPYKEHARIRNTWANNSWHCLQGDTYTLTYCSEKFLDICPILGTCFKEYSLQTLGILLTCLVGYL